MKRVMFILIALIPLCSTDGWGQNCSSNSDCASDKYCEERPSSAFGHPNGRCIKKPARPEQKAEERKPPTDNKKDRR